MRTFLPLFLIALAAPSQVVSFGIEAGVPIGPALSGFNNNFNASLDTGRWTVGPSLGVHVFRGFSFNTGMLFREHRTDYGGLSISNGLATTYCSISNARDFDFPALLKYRFLPGRGAHL